MKPKRDETQKIATSVPEKSNGVRPIDSAAKIATANGERATTKETRESEKLDSGISLSRSSGRLPSVTSSPFYS